MDTKRNLRASGQGKSTGLLHRKVQRTTFGKVGKLRKAGNLWRYRALRPRLMKKPSKRPKVKSISKLIKEADRLFSIQVRMKGSWKIDGIWSNRCYTHDTPKYQDFPIKKLHCGHYLSRIYKAARWHEDNSRPQCYVCNILKKGDAIVFRRNLIAEIGEARVLAVEALRHAPIKLSREFLEGKIKELLT